MQNNVDLAFYKKGLQCVRAAFFSNKLLLIHTRLIRKEKKNGFLNPSRVLSLQVMSFLGYLLRATSFVYIPLPGFSILSLWASFGFFSSSFIYFIHGVAFDWVVNSSSLLLVYYHFSSCCLG